MKFGVAMFPLDGAASAHEVALAAEERGFESYWVSEHSHIPVHAPLPFTGFDPKAYSSMCDPFVALGAAAVVTSTIKLGTAITLVPQRDPINCAKAVASIDQLSNGRFLFGIGAGWNEDELRNHRQAPESRFRLMRERVEAMQALWTQEQAEYHGRMVDYDPVWQWPKPKQQPHPPIYVAGSGPNVLKRVLRYGDGWLPVVVPEVNNEMRGRVTPIDEFKSLVTELAERAEAAGKPMPKVSVSGASADPEMFNIFQSLDVERMTFSLTPAPIDDVLRALDQLVAQIRELDHDFGRSSNAQQEVS